MDLGQLRPDAEDSPRKWKTYAQAVGVLHIGFGNGEVGRNQPKQILFWGMGTKPPYD